jgi:hypothetical protein
MRVTPGRTKALLQQPLASELEQDDRRVVFQRAIEQPGAELSKFELTGVAEAQSILDLLEMVGSRVLSGLLKHGIVSEERVLPAEPAVAHTGLVVRHATWMLPESHRSGAKDLLT